MTTVPASARQDIAHTFPRERPCLFLIPLYLLHGSPLGRKGVHCLAVHQMCSEHVCDSFDHEDYHRRKSSCCLSYYLVYSPFLKSKPVEINNMTQSQRLGVCVLVTVLVQFPSCLLNQSLSSSTTFAPPFQLHLATCRLMISLHVQNVSAEYFRYSGLNS